LRKRKLGRRARPLKAATSTIPIVVAGASNAPRRGFVASFARSAGNVTGLTSMSQELNAKRFELLKEAVSSLSRMAYLWEPATSVPHARRAGRPCGPPGDH
jgi:ABC-type uncharacterized transport system substrate-binding protein